MTGKPFSQMSACRFRKNGREVTFSERNECPDFFKAMGMCNEERKIPESGELDIKP